MTVLFVELFLRLYPSFLIYMNTRPVVQEFCTRPHPTIQFVNRENYQSDFVSREFHTTVHINDRGLRDRNFSYDKPQGCTRILVLGDSFAFGWGVESEESVAKVMESDLFNVDVINGACAGWGTQQEFLFLKEEGIRYHPDVVLLFFFENDPIDNVTRYKFVNDKLSYADRPVGRLADFNRWLIRHSTIYILLRQALFSHHGNAQTGTIPPDSQSAVWTSEEDWLREMQAFCRERQSALVIVYVPGKGRDRRPVQGEWFSRLKSFCADRGIPFLDLVPALTEASKKQHVYFRLDDHWNRNGHRAAADATRRFLLQGRWLAPEQAKKNE